MNKYRFLPFLLTYILLILSIVSVGNKTATVSNNNVATKDEQEYYIKGVWVSYITLDMQNTDKSKEAFEDKINTIVNTTKKSGFNTLVFQVRPFCDALYDSNIFPWSHILTGNQGENPNYDPLDIICYICHKNNMKVHAWINPYRVSTENTPKALSNSNPINKNKAIYFEHNGSMYLDPSNKDAQKLIVSGVEEIVKNYDIDGIQFDDYFYPDNSDDADDKQYQAYVNNANKPLSKQEWRKNNVNNLIKEVYKTVHKYSDNVIFGISPQGNIKNNDELGADVKKWCSKKGYIDYICPQLYFSLDNPTLSFEESLSRWLKLDKHKELSMYIGLAGYKGGTDEDKGTWQDNNDILKTEIQICEENKTDGIMLYSYESFNSEENKNEIKNVVQYLNGVK